MDLSEKEQVDSVNYWNQRDIENKLSLCPRCVNYQRFIWLWNLCDILLPNYEQTQLVRVWRRNWLLPLKHSSKNLTHSLVHTVNFW